MLYTIDIFVPVLLITKSIGPRVLTDVFIFSPQDLNISKKIKQNNENFTGRCDFD